MTVCAADLGTVVLSTDVLQAVSQAGAVPAAPASENKSTTFPRTQTHRRSGAGVSPSMPSVGPRRMPFGQERQQQPSEESSGVLSPVFDLELSQSDSCKLCGAYSLPDELDSGLPAACEHQELVILCNTHSGFELQLLEQVQLLKPECSGPSGFDISLLAGKLRGKGYLVETRSQEDRGNKAAYGRHCLENLHHTYIHCTGSLATYTKENIVVEPRFREQFQIAHTTPAYDTLLRVVPAEFVGPMRRLTAIAEILCAEIAAAFEQQGLPLPPWRKTKSMLSKWLPKGVREVVPPLDAHSRRVSVGAQLAAMRQSRLLSTALPQLPQHVHNLSGAVPPQQSSSRAVHAGTADSVASSTPATNQGTAAPAVGAAEPQPGGHKRVVSLLAKGLATAKDGTQAPAADSKPKQRRSPAAWALGLGHITTVRRLGPAVKV